MHSIRFVGMPTIDARAFQAGAADANGQPAEQHAAVDDTPCRHCLEDVAEGESFLILAYRLFPAAQPYAEIGPIFLHSAECVRYDKGAELPPMLTSPSYIVRGYDAADRIVYGSGGVVATSDLEKRAKEPLTRSEIRYLHVRSAANNCFQCRIERG